MADAGIAGETAAPPRRRRRPGSAPCVEVVLLTVLAVVMLFPVLWMLETSLKENRDVYAVPAKFFGFTLTLDHFKDVFVASAAVARRSSGRSSTPSWSPGSSTVLATVLGVPAAWAYSRFTLQGQEGPAVLHPLHPLHAAGRGRDPDLPHVPRARAASTRKLGLILIYAAFNLPFTIWMMKGFVDEVPAEYEEAAMLDGYSRLAGVLARHAAAARARASPRRRCSR